MTRRRSWWGWGYVDRQLDDAAVAGLGQLQAERFRRAPTRPASPADPEQLALRAPRVRLPGALAVLGSTRPRTAPPPRARQRLPRGRARAPR